MSKAFLRESDADGVPELPQPAALLPPGAKNLLTASGADRLRTELDRLVDEERPALVAGAGDDVEVRRELQAMDRRIRHLQGSLLCAEIVPPPSGPQEVVRFGSVVTVREADGAEMRYHIVGVDETDLSAEAVSWQAPLARALLNGRRGDQVEFRAPGGKRQLEIVAIE